MKDWNPILMLALFIAACFVAAAPHLGQTDTKPREFL